MYARRSYYRRPIRRTRVLRGYGSYRPSTYRRPVRRLRGYGDYEFTRSTFLRPYFKRGGRYVGGLAGARFGGGPGAAVGSKIGGRVGGLVADAIKTVSGFGDYVVKTNSLQEKILSGQPPQVNNSLRPGGGTRIHFREFIADIVSDQSNSFDLTAFPINPTNELTFPWLSQIAGNYQEWVPHGIIFEFRTMSADALTSSNTALGQVIMATQYNSSLPNFQSKPEMENSEFAKSIKPSDSCIHMIECSRQATVLSNLYTNPGNDDPRFSTLGIFQIATNGLQGSQVNVGELWISYDIELVKPKLFDSLGESDALLWFTNSDLTSVTGAAPLGTDTTLVQMSQSNVEPSFAWSSTRAYFPVSSVDKQYLFIWSVSGASTASTLPTFTATDCTIVQDVWSYPTAASAIQTPNSTTSFVMYAAIVHVPGDINITPCIEFGAGGTLPATVTRFDVKIIQVPNSLVYEVQP